MAKNQVDESFDGFMPEPEKTNEGKIKVAMGIATVLVTVFIVAVVGSILTRSVEKGQTLVYPESGLSNSIFESQNGGYTANEYLPYLKEFTLVPYLIDVPSDTAAEVDLGTSYKITDTDFAYVTEYEHGGDLPMYLAQQLGKAYVMEISIENCAVEEVGRQEGFLNGNAMTYIVYKTQFADAEMNGFIVYVMGYEIEVNYEVSVFIAVSTADGTSDTLAYYKQYLDMMAYSYRYDEALDLQRQAEEEALKEQQAQEEAEKEMAQEQAEQEQAPEEESQAQAYYEQWYASQHETVDLVADGSGTQKIDCETDSAFKSCSFKFTFTKPTEDLVYHMVDPDGEIIELSDLQVNEDDSLIAIYNVSDSKKGVYSVVFDKGGCTYTTPALEIFDYTVYTSSELLQLQSEQREANTTVPVEDGSGSVSEINDITENIGQ